MNTNTKGSDFLLGAIDHHDWADVCCWHRSALRNGFTGQVVILCYEHMTEQAIARIRAEGIKVLRATSNRGVNEDRFRDVADFVKTLNPEDRIMMCDVRDVAFQVSIHKVLDGLLKDKPLACASEGMAYGSSEWNLNNVTSNFPQMVDEISPMEIYCAGAIAGRAGRFAAFCRAIWEQSIQAKSFNGDQIAMNLVMRTPEFAKDVNCLPADNTLICHHGSPGAAAHMKVEKKALVSLKGERVGVFHQYTRNPGVRRGTLILHGCLISFYGGKLITAIRRKLGMQPDWIPYWITTPEPAPQTQNA